MHAYVQRKPRNGAHKHARSNPTNVKYCSVAQYIGRARCSIANRTETYYRNVGFTSLQTHTHAQHARGALSACSRCACNAPHNRRSTEHTSVHIVARRRHSQCTNRSQASRMTAMSACSTTPKLRTAFVVRLTHNCQWPQLVRQCGQIADAVGDGASHASTTCVQRHSATTTMNTDCSKYERKDRPRQ
jgi:hypothetical protein